MREGLPKNPFLRDNPFYIPQKFYSQSHLKQNSFLNETTNKYGNFPRISIETKQNVSYGEIIKYSILLKKEKQQLQNTQKLVKKALNKRQSPFTRKNLLQNNYLRVENTIEKVQYLGFSRETEEIRNVKQKFMRQSIKNLQQIIKYPQMKHLQISQEMSSPNKQKYLASQLKIKLRSQTYLEQSHEEPLTEQKTTKIKEPIYYPPKLKWKGKLFYLREVI